MTLKELQKLDRKIMEGDYMNSYRMPPLWVKILWMFMGCLAIVCSCVIAYAAIYMFIKLI